MISANEARARPQPDQVASLARQLRNDYGERAMTTQAIREQHSHGGGLADAALPELGGFRLRDEGVAAGGGGCGAVPRLGGGGGDRRLLMPYSKGCES